MAEVSEDPKFTLRLLIDEEKNKVFLAEADRDFVDVLFSFLTLPMGTIVRLIEKHRKSESIGCFSNLYNSVADVGVDNFETEACQEMLLNPRSVKGIHCKRLKLNINPVDDLNYFKCSSFSDCNVCSKFSGSECVCGELMDQKIELSEEDQLASGGSIRNGVDGVFVKGRSSFIITDDFLVSVGSTGLVLKTLNRLGCSDVSKLGEQFLDVGLQEILTLLENMIFSNTPLTNTFLKKQSPRDVNDIQKLLMSLGVKVKTEFTLELDAIVRKQDMKILYVECGEDFVDFLFTFLAVPLEFVCDINLGCIGNLRRSFKDLSVVDHTASKCVLPYYYKCQKQLSGITIEEPPEYYRYRNSNPRQPDYSLTTDPDRTLLYRKDRLVPVTLIDPKCRGKDQSENGSGGFVKRGTRFTVTDDLIITPRNSLSTSICLLKKLQIQADDLEVQVISIREAEAMSLMRASLLTSSALNSAFWNLIAKKKIKEET
ncbi:PREDICTED: uncharacterized protein LOC104768354 [Camelina sativa]|uniref:Uncharacterized protein LOC104768354 n=1 Tax=Camelina sativa TaxID=90675 RepID=A0ABM0XT02_CAMSA|nr:PREDICTED: uncharacterized protein LOC104768354 [Camelina sativa]